MENLDLVKLKESTKDISDAKLMTKFGCTPWLLPILAIILIPIACKIFGNWGWPLGITIFILSVSFTYNKLKK